MYNEQEKPEPTGEIVIPDLVAKYFFSRLTDLCELLQRLHEPNCPIQYYNGIRIFSRFKGDKECLEWGVFKGIGDARNTLVERGFGLEATAAINFFIETDGRKS